MNFTGMEKLILGVMVALVASLILMASLTVSAMNEMGGVKGLLIEAGKEVKEISHEIEKHQVGNES